MIIRTSSRGAGKLVRITLAAVDVRYRRQVSRRIREQRWDHELRPDTGYSPDMATRIRVLLDSALMEGAACSPSRRGYYVPVEVVEDVIAKHGAE